MSDPLRTLVIGAGPAGLTAARALAGAGAAPTVLEKSRGLGGRVATRRSRDGAAWDHGTPALPADDPALADLLGPAKAAGAAARWNGRIVGLPGMSGLLAPLAAGLDIRFGAEASALSRQGGRWRVDLLDGGTEVADRLALAIPAPQAARLLADAAPEAARALAPVVMAPGWTLMLELERPWDRAEAESPADGPVRWVGRETSKPGRDPARELWTAHARPDWTRPRLELDREAAVAPLLAALAEAAGDPPPVRRAVAHRWRHARTEAPLGAPCLHDPDLGLAVGGDWALGPDVADALASGRALAAALVG